ncbi:MAG: peptide ABC transporter substrate-binding protein [Elusimicrobiota bacterium]
MEHIKESDWKLLRRLQPKALDRLCKCALDDIAKISTKRSFSHYERFQKAFALLQDRNADMARAFDNLRRSSALPQLSYMVHLDLLAKDELAEFSAETRDFLSAARRAARYHK